MHIQCELIDWNEQKAKYERILLKYPFTLTRGM